jgi:hypothetical protein
MRDRLTELLPLLLVGVVLLVVQLMRQGPSVIPLAVGVAATSTPAVAIAGATAVRTRPAQATQVAARQSRDGCTPDLPRFVGGMALLRSALGSAMGEAIECERSIDLDGNTQQKTTTGLAYYRRKLNVACFTTGWDHWAVSDRGLVHWSGDAVDPPPDARPIAH